MGGLRTGDLMRYFLTTGGDNTGGLALINGKQIARNQNDRLTHNGKLT